MKTVTSIALVRLTSISDSFHFVHVIVVNDVIKSGVKLIEEIHYLVGGAGARQLSKTHYITGQKKERNLNIHMEILNLCPRP